MKQLKYILRHPDIAVPFGEEILQWHRDFKDKTKAGVRTRKAPIRCHKCQLLTLTETDGDGYVECGNCGLRIPKAEYDAEVARLGAALERGELESEVA